MEWQVRTTRDPNGTTAALDSLCVGSRAKISPKVQICPRLEIFLRVKVWLGWQVRATRAQNGTTAIAHLDAEGVVVEVDYAVTPVPFCSDTVPRVPG